MIVSNPGIYGWYPSYLCSKYYIWFCELGYPNLDIKEDEDGEWHIIEFYNAPVMPCLTRWNYVLTGLKNIIPTPSFVTKYVKQLDLHRKEVWDIAEAKSQKAEERHADLEKHAEDTANKAFEVIRGNPDLMERVARKGLSEIDPLKIAKNIPSNQLIGLKV